MFSTSQAAPDASKPALSEKWCVVASAPCGEAAWETTAPQRSKVPGVARISCDGEA
ncbi:hypothetical protein FQZ97_1254550 [compost metagenome]